MEAAHLSEPLRRDLLRFLAATSAVSIVPLQVLAHRLAIARVREAGTYLRPAKVTTRE